MSCCAEKSIASLFDEREAERELKRYRKNGPNATTQALIDVIARQGIAGASLLDIGGGVGAVYHGLLDRGAARATHVDISTAYIAVAHEEAARRDLTHRVEWLAGNFVDVERKVPDADVVTLDRVICCYPDMERLVTASARHARRLYGAVYPREGWWARVAVAAFNLWHFVTGNDFRTFAHPPRAIAAVLRRAGFEPTSVQRTFFWEVALFARAA